MVALQRPLARTNHFGRRLHPGHHRPSRVCVLRRLPSSRRHNTSPSSPVTGSAQLFQNRPPRTLSAPWPRCQGTDSVVTFNNVDTAFWYRKAHNFCANSHACAPGRLDDGRSHSSDPVSFRLTESCARLRGTWRLLFNSLPELLALRRVSGKAVARASFAVSKFRLAPGSLTI